MQLASVAASDRATFLFRVTADGLVEQRVITREAGGWSEWTRAPLEPRALAVAAISGREEQIEIFVLDETGLVWNRWWWLERGWVPEEAFSPQGRPFTAKRAQELAALSAGEGHFDVFVVAEDGELAVLPHGRTAEGYGWLRCQAASALGDGWWPALASASRGAYRLGEAEP